MPSGRCFVSPLRTASLGTAWERPNEQLIIVQTAKNHEDDKMSSWTKPKPGIPGSEFRREIECWP